MKTYPTIKGLSFINKLFGVLLFAYCLMGGLYAISEGQVAARPTIIFGGLIAGFMIYTFGEVLSMVRDMAENISASTDIDLREFKEKQAKKPGQIKRLKKEA